jgi:hypothetical protein
VCPALFLSREAGRWARMVVLQRRLRGSGVGVGWAGGMRSGGGPLLAVARVRSRPDLGPKGHGRSGHERSPGGRSSLVDAFSSAVWRLASVDMSASMLHILPASSSSLQPRGGYRQSE